MGILAVQALVAGCASHTEAQPAMLEQKPVGARLASADAIRIALDVAKQRGIDASKFHQPITRFDAGNWFLLFKSNQLPVGPGDHFSVLIDDKTGEASFHGGK